MRRAIAVISALTVLVLSIVCLGGCNKNAEDDYVVKIGAESVFVPEFRFYFLLSQLAYESEGGVDIWLTTINGVKAEDVAKDRTFESIARVKISHMQAASLGVSLTDEDRQKAAETSASYRDLVNESVLDEIGATDELLQKIFEETMIYGKVFDEVTKHVQISEKDFTIFFENYIKDPKNNIEVDNDLAELSEYLRALYTMQTKNEVFTEQYSKWEANVEISKNTDVWDTIHIIPSDKL